MLLRSRRMRTSSMPRLPQYMLSSSHQLPDLRFKVFYRCFLDEAGIRHEAGLRIHHTDTGYVGDSVVFDDVVLPLIEADHIKRSVLPVPQKHDDRIAGLELRHSGNPCCSGADLAADLPNENR